MKKIVFGVLVFISVMGWANEPVNPAKPKDPVNPIKITRTGATIKGVVKDEINELLVGAAIQVDGGMAGAVTGLDGSFYLPNIQQGKHDLTISYIGYEPLNITVSIPPDATTHVLDTLGLTPDAVMLNEAVVYGSIIKGELKAMSMKKASFKIVDVIASDGIGKLPDRNAGEAVQRIPGVSIERDQGEEPGM